MQWCIEKAWIMRLVSKNICNAARNNYQSKENSNNLVLLLCITIIFLHLRVCCVPHKNIFFYNIDYLIYSDFLNIKACKLISISVMKYYPSFRNTSSYYASNLKKNWGSVHTNIARDLLKLSISGRKPFVNNYI